jgi:endonuclease/exonuclease/phosphatase family metal-dependent hydrolase
VPGLRLATFNVAFGHVAEGADWSERLPLFRRAIERARPDILGLQEVFPSYLPRLEETLGGLAVVAGPCSGPSRWIDPSPIVERLANAARGARLPELFSHSMERMTTGELVPIAYEPARFRALQHGAFWISPTPEQPGSMLPLAISPFVVHWVRFERMADKATLLVLNVHLGHAPWHHGVTVRTLIRQLDALRTNSRPPSAPDAANTLGTFLIGDFNATPSSSLIRGLTSASGVFVDAVRAARERIGPASTFHWGLGANRLGLKLDHVLARGAPRARTAEVIDVHDGRLRPSDHHPLVVEFEDETPSGAPSERPD